MITELALWLVAGCGRPAGPGAGGSEPIDADSAVNDTAVVDTATPGTTHTDPSTADPGAEPAPGCSGLPSGSCLHLAGRDGGWAGRWIDVADLDGDGLVEVLVPEPANGDPYLGEATVHVLHQPDAPGLLVDEAWLRVDGPDSDFSYWGDPATLIAGAAQVALADASDGDYLVKVFEAAGPGALVAGQHVGSILVPAPYTELGIPSRLKDCQAGAGTPALCVTSINTDTEVSGNQAGQVFVFDAPVLGVISLLDARAQYQFAPGESGRAVEGETDLDGDGVHDLVLGAYDAEGVGKLAVLHAPPDGLHDAWDVADATWVGVEPGGSLGLGIGAGDLDGDGYGDVLAGAPIGEPANAYAARGPHAGDRSVAEAEWSVVGEVDDWLGYDLGVGDFDGDGAPDLAVGAPRSIYSGKEPGTVLVFLAPAPGTYTSADAAIVLSSGVGLPDAFGVSLDIGDIDGDGRDDLAVGAPRDPTSGSLGGSVTLLFGAAL